MESNSEQKAPNPPPSIPGYRILQQLGTGGMATVYLARQETPDRDVALKIMAPALAADPQYGDRFRREALIAARFSHPNIIAIHDVGEYGNHYYIAMEYHAGGDLKKRLKKNMTTKRAMVILRQMASALEYAHSQGYIHRDVKPDNILFREDGGAVLTDFGIARPSEVDSQVTQLGTVVGTPKYMSPEQARGHELDARADIYALGIVFYEMLVGDVPYDGNDAISIGIKHVKEPIPELPEELASLQPMLDKLLAKDVDDRYKSGREVIIDLDKLRLGDLRNQKLQGQRPSHATRAEQLEPAPTPRREQQPKTAPTTDKPQRNWPLRLLLPAVLAGGVYYAHSNGLLNHWLDRAAETPALKSSAETLQTWLGYKPAETLAGDDNAEQQSKLPDWFKRKDQPESAKELTPNAREARTTDAAAASVGTAVSSQALPGVIDGGLIASHAAGALSDINPATLPGLDKQTQIINELLDQARALDDAGKRLDPVGANALEVYREVLTLDEGNETAQAGIDAIALSLVNNASEALENGNWEELDRLLEQARRAELERPELTRIEGQLDRAREAEAALLAQQQAAAEAQRKQAEQARSEAAEEAQRRQAQADAAAKAEQDARAEEQAQAERAAAAAAAAATVVASQPGQAVSETAPQAVPQASDSAPQQPETQAPATTSEPVSAEVLTEAPAPVGEGLNQADAMLIRFKLRGLLKNAEYDVAAGRYTRPVGNNALQKYREVLRLNPGNVDAQQGLQSLEATIVDELDAAIASGDEALAATRLKQLEQVAPQNPRLQ